MRPGRRLCCLLLFASAIPCFAQEARLSGLDIESRMAHYQVPGVSIAVIRNNSIEWAKAYGYRDVERKLPVDTQTMFEAGSISKPVAAMGALWLVEQGKLNLDENVNEKLKSWKVPVPTLLQVLDGIKPANTSAVRVDTMPGKAWALLRGGYEFMAQTVLRKIEMDRSRYDQPLLVSLAGNAATAEKGAAVPGKYHTYPEMAAAGLWTPPVPISRAWALRS